MSRRLLARRRDISVVKADRRPEQLELRHPAQTRIAKRGFTRVPNSVMVQKPYAPAQLTTAISTLLTRADTGSHPMP